MALTTFSRKYPEILDKNKYLSQTCDIWSFLLAKTDHAVAGARFTKPFQVQMYPKYCFLTRSLVGTTIDYC